MEGVSPSVPLVPAQSKSRRLAAKACWAAWVRMADQRERRGASTALRRMWGNALAFVWAKRRRKVVASGLHRPPVSMARTTSLHLLERRSSGYVRSLALRASWSAAPAYWPARLRGWLEEVKGDTRVVSTASCAPPHNGSPLAITSILLSSCRLMWSRLRSLRRVLVVTLAPASGKLWLLPFPKESLVPVKPRPGHMLRDGRLMRLKCDGTDRCGLTGAVGDGGVGGVGHGRGERDRWCLIQRGWW